MDRKEVEKLVEKRGFVLLKLGFYDTAVSAFFHDGSTVIIPYGDADQALATLLLGIHEAGLPVIVENPLAIEPIPYNLESEFISERLVFALTLREGFRLSGVPLLEIPGSVIEKEPEGPESLRLLIQRLRSAFLLPEKARRVETDNDYEAFLRSRTQYLSLLPNFYAAVIKVALDYSLPLFLPVLLLLREKEEINSLQSYVKDEKKALRLAEAMQGTPLGSASDRTILCCALYSVDDVTDLVKMAFVATAMLEAKHLAEERKQEGLLRHPFTTLFGEICEELGAPAPRHRPLSEADKSFVPLLSSECYIRPVFLPLLVDLRRATREERENILELLGSYSTEHLTSIARAIKDAFGLSLDPLCGPPVEPRSLMASVFDLVNQLTRSSE